MKLFGVILLTALILNSAAAAQENASNPPPAAANPSNPPPAPTNNNNSSNQQRDYQAAQQRSVNQRQIMLNQSLELEMISRRAADPFTRVRPDVDKLYRKTNKKDLNKLSLNQQDFTDYAAFLRAKNTGLIKLLPDAGCDKGTSIVVVTDNCLKYDFPGAGSAYSFRIADYRSQQLSDLIFTGEHFYSNSVWTQGLFVAVGDVPLEQINLQSPAMKYLSDLQPEIEQEKALEFQRKLERGIKSGGFIYSQAVAAQENTTYLLRSVAYNGRFYREIKGVVYDEFAFDKRKDVIVGFRVIRKEPDGAVTILWKEFNRQDSPKFVQKNKK